MIETTQYGGKDLKTMVEDVKALKQKTERKIEFISLFLNPKSLPVFDSYFSDAKTDEVRNPLEQIEDDKRIEFFLPLEKEDSEEPIDMYRKISFGIGRDDDDNKTRTYLNSSTNRQIQKAIHTYISEIKQNPEKYPELNNLFKEIEKKLHNWCCTDPSVEVGFDFYEYAISGRDSQTPVITHADIAQTTKKCEQNKLSAISNWITKSINWLLGR